MRNGRLADLLLTPRALLNHGSRAWDAKSFTFSEKTAAAGRTCSRTAMDRVMRVMEKVDPVGCTDDMWAVFGHLGENQI